MRYGAWYLNTKLWKKQRADEPLVDPKVSHKGQDENFKKELQEQVCVYAEIWSSELNIITVLLPLRIEGRVSGVIQRLPEVLQLAYKIQKWESQVIIGGICNKQDLKFPGFMVGTMSLKMGQPFLVLLPFLIPWINCSKAGVTWQDHLSTEWISCHGFSLSYYMWGLLFISNGWMLKNSKVQSGNFFYAVSRVVGSIWEERGKG